MTDSASASRLQRFLERAETAGTVDEIWTAALELARGEGFVRLSYLHHDPAAPQVSGLRFASGFDPEWIAAYQAEDLARVDPVPWTAMAETDPFRWSRAGALRPMTQAEHAFMERFRAAGGGDGVAIQAFGPRQRKGYVGLGHDGQDPQGDAEGRHAPERLRMLQAAFQAAHLCVCRLLDARLPPAPTLSVREREVLGWMAQGKSNPAIAGILGCSVHTVDTHVRRLFSKLDVRDRISCVVRAAGLGLVPA
ncbi:helix-turn-helix transcriptional regulator [Albimonas pacifica]|uniref:Transcriptional regulator, LuxR family n=1 Tax=Albimonas pacifica TaxID=1114924 RepID=A0A1I3ITD8_9RHOB|nr:LuxR family transcriptional regulator [Albimonas pacifica]SFI51110.1 transcriptional regulator, LuxR family [Albimonas pacifica]